MPRVQANIRTEGIAPELPFDLGCPVWACAGWDGIVYPRGAARHDWLSWYSQTFNAIEGNSTFYGLPSIATVEKWCKQTAEGFRFSFKFPQAISHQSKLVDASASLGAFFSVLQVLADSGKLGTTFLQLPPNFCSRDWPNLERFLASLPRHWAWAVELRHLDWYDDGPWETRVNELLTELQMDKVIFDTRVLFQGDTDNPAELEARRRKPKTPFRTTATGQRPFVRFVGRNDMQPYQEAIDQWAEITVGWIREGRRPQIFTHAPDDTFAPDFARRFASAVGLRLNGVPIELPRPPQPPSQMSLF